VSDDPDLPPDGESGESFWESLELVPREPVPVPEAVGTLKRDGVPVLVRGGETGGSDSEPRATALLSHAGYVCGLYAVVCCLLLPVHWSPSSRVALAALIGGLAIAGAGWSRETGALPPWREVLDPGGRGAAEVRGPFRRVGALLAQLTPVAALAAVFPLVGSQIHHTTIGGASLSSILMAGSATMPLLAQAACAPLYRALGEDIYEGGREVLPSSFLARWPGVFVRSLPLVPLLCAPFALSEHWSLHALLGLACFDLGSLAMLQWLVVPIMERRYFLWAAAWIAYALTMLMIPRLCLLMPLAALAVLAVAAAVRPTPRALRKTTHVWGGFGRGMVQGTLIWLNILLLLIVSEHSFRPTLVFLSVLPAVIVFNAYYALLAPGLEHRFNGFQHVLEKAPVTRLQGAREHLSRQVRGKFVVIGLGLAVATLLEALVSSSQHVLATRLYTGLTICSLGFCLEAIFVYDLVQLKRDRTALVISILHCVLFSAALIIWSPTALFYTANAGIELIVIAILAVIYSREIAEPEYALFWRHAYAW
jgi:hypothetical protein